MTHTALVSAVESRVHKASKPGEKDEATFEASRCLAAIKDHTDSPREFSADFIDRQWARIESLVHAS